MNIIIVGGWRRLYKRLQSIGHCVFVCHKKASMKAEDFECINRFIDCDMTSYRSVKRAIKKILTEPIDFVLCFEEQGLLNTARVCTDFNLRSHSLYTVSHSINKQKMRSLIADLNNEMFYCKISQLHIRDILFQPYPMIVKPINGTGSSNIHMVRSPEELISRVKNLDLNRNIVESFIEGNEYSVEYISHNGLHKCLGITEKYKFANTFVESSHIFPAKLNSPLAEEVQLKVEALLNKIQLENGPSHTEVIVRDGSVYIVETHSRAGGDHIYDLVEQVTNINMFSDWIYEEDFQKPVQYNGVSAIFYFDISEGTIRSVNTCIPTSAINTLCKYHIPFDTGSTINKPKDSDSCNGYALFHGNSLAEVQHGYEKLIQILDIMYEE